MKRSKALFYNLLLMTATTLLMRLVGVAFNIYVTNRIGAYGIGLFSLVMSVGAFAVTFATSGVNLAATRLTAEALGRGSDTAVRQAMRRCIVYSICFGAAASAGLALLAKPVSLGLLNDERCIRPLLLLSLSLPFISLSSAMHGYFNALRRVVKSAAAQIFEQLVKICVCVYAIGLLAPRGIEYACIAVILGGVTAETASFIFTLVMYLGDLARHNTGTGEADTRVTHKLLGISLPIALTAYVRSGLVTIEHLLIPRGLRRSGNSPERALASYGALHGMVFPIILFPQAVLSAFAGLLVPELAECMARGEQERIDHIASRVIQSTLAFAVGTSGIMLCYSSLLGSAIYSSTEASALIRILSPLIPVMYLDHVVDGMLKGLGEQLYSMRVNIADAFMSVVLVYFVVPVMGIWGYVLIIYAMELVNASLSLCRLLARTSVRVRIGKWLCKPLLCIAGATSAAGLIIRAMPPAALGTAGDAAFAVTLTALLYFVLLRMTGGLSAADIRWFRTAVR